MNHGKGEREPAGYVVSNEVPCGGVYAEAGLNEGYILESQGIFTDSEASDITVEL
jgi:hypothetical protein